MKPEPYMLPSGRLANAEGLVVADNPRQITLVATLTLAVPMWIWDLCSLTDDQRAARANRCGRIVAERGDVLQFGSKKRGQATEVFNALAEGLACAAYQPGGVDFAGKHWCTNHRLCLDAAAAASEAPTSDCDPTPVPSAPKRLVETTAFGEAVRGLL